MTTALASGRFRERGRRSPAGGFTLLEVLVAMAILAMVMVVLLQNHSMSIKLSERARKSSLAANLARDLMTDVELEGFPEIGSEEGDFTQTYPGLYPGFTWQREVNESIFADYIREVAVRVTYYDGTIPYTFELLDIVSARDEKEQQLAESGGGGASGASPFEQALMGQYGGDQGGGDQGGGDEGGE